MTKTHNHSDLCEIEKKFGFKHNENPNFQYTYKLIQLNNYDQKDDTQRRMAWFSLIGMILYPILVIIAELFNLDNASQLISDMSGVYFASVSVIVMAYFGANAYTKRKGDLNNSDYRDASGISNDPNITNCGNN